jgi:prolyl 4-hydroxylase
MYNFIETYKMNTILCDNLIEYHKKNTEYKNIGLISGGKIDKKIKDSTDSSFYNNSNNQHIKDFFNGLTKKLVIYREKYGMKESINTSLCNNIQHYKPNAGYPVLHYERGETKRAMSRQLVYMLYLNTVTDKGGTRFPYQKITTPAIKGNLILWPAEFTHPHQGIISPTQEKYIATGWFDIV